MASASTSSLISAPSEIAEEHSAEVDEILLVCAQHDQNGLPSWDRHTVCSILLSKKGFASSLRLLVTKLVVPRLEGVNALSNLHDLTLGTHMAMQFQGLPALRTRDLSPLTGLTSLTNLSLADTRVHDVRVLVWLPLLRVLSLASCEGVSDLSPLHGLSLRQLDLSSTPVADITPLAHMSSLEVLRLDRCRKLCTLTPHLPGLRVLSLTRGRVGLALKDMPGPALEELDLSHTFAEDITPLSAMSKLRVLHLENMLTLRHFEPIADLHNLELLNLRNTRLAHVAVLAGLTGLRVLNLAATTVSDLAPLQQLTHLEELDVQGTEVGDLAPAAAMHSLRHLDVSYCAQLRDVSRALGAFRLTGLASLSMDARSPDALHYLPLPLLTLTKLDIGEVEGQVSEAWLAPLAHLTRLKWLSLHTTAQVDLGPLRGLPLERLDCRSTGVADLTPLASCPTLSDLRCYDCLHLVNVAPLSRLSRLKCLSLRLCPLQDITPLAGLLLERLDLSLARVHDLSPLRSMHTLVYLNISYTPVQDLSPLAGLAGLQVLAARGCQAVGAPAGSMVQLQAEQLHGDLSLSLPYATMEGETWFDARSWLHRDLVVGRDFSAVRDTHAATVGAGQPA